MTTKNQTIKQPPAEPIPDVKVGQVYLAGEEPYMVCKLNGATSQYCLMSLSTGLSHYHRNYLHEITTDAKLCNCDLVFSMETTYQL